MTDLLQPGQIFAGRYRVERFLAKGGFGAIYVAEQTETELRVALKILFRHVLASEVAVEQFKLEARIAGRIESDHIVKVFDAGFDQATEMPFLVMELLRGSDLETFVKRSGPVPPALVAQYFRQIASALDRAHSYVDKAGVARPIVHRDLKPQNLFLTHRETGDPCIKILDFGIAKVLSDTAAVSHDIKGTPLYMAYEQAASGRVTPQTDIWALGLIAFYLLTGRVYWRAAEAEQASLPQLFGEVLSLPIEPPSLRAPELASVVVPSSFDAWFLQCVERDPSRRFQTAGQCARALGEALRMDSHAPPSSRANPYAATAHGGNSGSVAAVTPALAGSSVPAGLGGTAGSMALGRTYVEPKTRSVLLALGGVLATGALGYWLFAHGRPAESATAALADAIPSAAAAPTELLPKTSAKGEVILDAGKAPRTAESSIAASSLSLALPHVEPAPAVAARRIERSTSTSGQPKTAPSPAPIPTPEPATPVAPSPPKLLPR